MIRSWLIGLILLGTLSWAHAQKFTAFVDKSTVSTRDALKVSFRLENAQGTNLKYPDFQGFSVVGGPNTSTSMQFINGQVSQSTIYSFYLQPQKTGTLTIGAASIKVGDETLSTEPIQVTAVAGKAPPAQAPGASSPSTQSSPAARSQDIEAQIKDNLFLKAIVSDREVYQGEQITVSYKLYRRVDISQLVPEESPRYEGFWVENVDLPQVAAKIEVVNGVQFRTSVIKQDILFPQRSGELSIDPLQLACVVQVRTQNRSRRQSIFDSFFGSYENYEYSFANAPVKIKVNPLPSSSRPADFNGMIGKLQLNVSLDTTATETGEPITMKVRISGEGNIKKLPEPRLEFPPDFEVYDPVVSEQVSRHQGRLGGRRTYEYLLVPRNPGTYDLPKVAFSYFDVGKKRYEQLSGPDFQVQVSGEPMGGFSASGTGMSKEDMELIGQNIRHIQTTPPKLTPKGASPLQKGWFWGLYLLPFVVMGGLVWYQRKQAAEASDVVGTKAKRATKVAKKRLSNAQALLNQGDEKGFYDEMTRALWGYLGDRFRLGQSDLTREQVSEVLSERGVSEALISQLTEVLDTCEMALFAPVSAQGGAQRVYEQGVAFITEAEASISKA